MVVGSTRMAGLSWEGLSWEGWTSAVVAVAAVY
jgi:hypothetical protein